MSLVIKFFRFLLFSYLPFLLRGCGSSLKAAIMGRYPVGGSGPVCKTGAYYARMVRAHLSPPIIYGRVAQLEEHRKIIDFWEIVEQQFSNCFGSRMPKVRVLPRPPKGENNMQNLFNKFFCCHSWALIQKIIVEDGEDSWIKTILILSCRKCGKIKKIKLCWCSSTGRAALL